MTINSSKYFNKIGFPKNLTIASENIPINDIAVFIMIY